MICLQMRKTYMAKTPLDNFKVTTSENPLLSKQAVISKGIPVPFTNLQLNPYPNTQLDLFYSDNFSFRCTALSTWLTNCANPSTWLQSPTREGCWLQVLQFIPMMKIKKMLGQKTLFVKMLLSNYWATGLEQLLKLDG